MAYKVNSQDTWSSIAQNIYGSPYYAQQLAAQNPSISVLYRGQVLRTDNQSQGYSPYGPSWQRYGNSTQVPYGQATQRSATQQPMNTSPFWDWMTRGWTQQNMGYNPSPFAGAPSSYYQPPAAGTRAQGPVPQRGPTPTAQQARPAQAPYQAPTYYGPTYGFNAPGSQPTPQRVPTQPSTAGINNAYNPLANYGVMTGGGGYTGSSSTFNFADDIARNPWRYIRATSRMGYPGVGGWNVGYFQPTTPTAGAGGAGGGGGYGGWGGYRGGGGGGGAKEKKRGNVTLAGNDQGGGYRYVQPDRYPANYANSLGFIHWRV